ncbi:MAG: recombinase family protein [Desulfitobacteriaceae bacterium]
MIIGYARVSTKGQLKDGHSLEVQKQEIFNRYENAQMHFEQFTGATTERPIFNKIICELKNNDTLVVSKLDRLARNTVEGIQIVQELFDRGVAVHVLNVGLLENTSMGKFFLTTLLAVAEMERNTIIERTQTGKAIAKTKAGFKEGRPKEFTETQINMALDLLGKHSYTRVAEMTKISKATLTREMRRRKASLLEAI